MIFRLILWPFFLDTFSGKLSKSSERNTCPPGMMILFPDRRLEVDFVLLSDKVVTN